MGFEEKDFFTNTELGRAAQKPEVEEMERDHLHIRVNRKRADGIIEVRLRGASDATEFQVQDGRIISGTVDHFGSQDVDQKSDSQLLRVHSETVMSLINEGKI